MVSWESHRSEISRRKEIVHMQLGQPQQKRVSSQNVLYNHTFLTRPNPYHCQVLRKKTHTPNGWLRSTPSLPGSAGCGFPFGHHLGLGRGSGCLRGGICLWRSRRATWKVERKSLKGSRKKSAMYMRRRRMRKRTTRDCVDFIMIMIMI